MNARPDAGESSTAMTLRYLIVSDEEAAVRAHQELAPDGFDFLFDHHPGTDWAEYLDGLERERLAHDLRPGRVAASYLVAEVSGELVGRVSLRHTLNPFLRTIGGHIGYAIRPQFRRRGFATQILRLSLVRAHELGIEKALVTCDADNVGSRTVIERCGGVRDVDGEPDAGAMDKLRYWIDTTHRKP